MNNSTITDADWAYLAGIIDGDGAVVFALRGKRKSSYETRICVYNTDDTLIEWIKSKFGGHYYSNATNVTKDSSHLGSKPVHKIYWCSKADVLFILSGVLSHLIVKQKDALAMWIHVNARK